MKNPLSKMKNYTLITAAAVVLSHLSAFAQEATAPAAPAAEPSLFSNALFLTLLVIIAALFFIILGLSRVMISLADFKRLEIKASKKGAAAIVGLFLLSSMSSYAQEAAAPAVQGDMGIGGISSGMFYALSAIILIEVLVIAMLMFSITLLLKKEGEAEEEEEAKPSFLDSFNASVAIENEGDIMLDHNYDGIKELDNNLPPWWKYGFYLTIVWSVVYLGYFHMGGSGKLQIDEYNEQLAEAEIKKAEYLKKAGNLVDENNVKLSTEAAFLSAGKEAYVLNCKACHGEFGEGGVGPNLTDDYWIHGGSIKDVFKTIKYGYPDKGMKSWEADLSPMQISQIASFIKSLRGTNPANGKEKQGELYSEEGAAAVSDSAATAIPDSAAAKTDSAAVAEAKK